VREGGESGSSEWHSIRSHSPHPQPQPLLSLSHFKNQSLDLDVDFAARVVRGTAAITLRATAAGAASPGGGVAEAWLDTSNLEVLSASAAAASDDKGKATSSPSSSSSSFSLDEPHPVLGSRLRVPLPKPLILEGETAKITVSFSTTARGTALQWLTPEMTSGKKEPFLFTQCQAIHARSFLPCQDTPGAKVTYDARVTVPEGLTPRMSALDDVEGGGEREEAVDDEGRNQKKKKKRFSFKQPVPLSPYLLALAVGDLSRRDLSPRCAVWAEPSVVDAAAAEFAEIEGEKGSFDFFLLFSWLSFRPPLSTSEPRSLSLSLSLLPFPPPSFSAFLAAVEQESMRPFRWHRADLLVLPKSFPYGGMKSLPTIFITPTLVVGDGSQASVVAHELCHSVFGNDVSCATWSDFWLNEGFTVWLERRVVRRVRGEGAAALSAASGLAALKESVRSFGEEHPFTRLVPLLPAGADPDDAFSKVPYEKGYCFIKYLEGLVDGEKGEKEKKKGNDDGESESEFARWVSERYVSPRVGLSATTEDFKAAFLSSFGDRGFASEIDWEVWLYSPGMPPVEVAAPSELGGAAEALARKWSEAADDEKLKGPPADAAASDVAGWPAQQVTFFLEALAELRAEVGKPLPASSAAALGELYGVEGGPKANADDDDKDDDATAGAGVVGGCEVLVEYLCLALAAGHPPAVPAAAALLQKVGRMKYTRPLFRALAAADAGAAREAFASARAGLHPICAKMVASDLGLAEEH